MVATGRNMKVALTVLLREAVIVPPKAAVVIPTVESDITFDNSIDDSL